MYDLSAEHPNSLAPQRVLVFGGTFDPPHIAHARLPVQAAAQLGCDQILYVPTAINPLKTDGPHVAREHRLAMLWLALADVPNAKISMIELDRAEQQGGPSYTIDTLRTLRTQYPLETEFRLLIGSDQALDFHRWKEWREIVELASPAVMVRPPWDSESFAAALRENYAPDEVEQWLSWTLRLPLMHINATQVRELVRAGNEPAVADMLDPAVLNYINANQLYR